MQKMKVRSLFRTYQLFYFVDLGLYKCVVSNPVGTTATTATLKVDRKFCFL
jgi:hypothetical protein